MKLKKLKWTIIFGGLVLFTACTSDVKVSPTKTVGSTPAVVANPIVTATPAPTQVATVLITPNINPTQAVTVVPTQISLTPLPSLTVVTAIVDPSFSYTPPPTPVVAPVIKDYVRRWLKDSTCKPPCWEGITPGVTTLEQALKILAGLPFIETNSITNHTNSDINNYSYGWKLTSSPSGGTVSYRQTNNVNIVNAIIPPHYGVYVELKEVIDIFGEPEYVYAYTQYGAGITFYWLKQGLLAGQTIFSPVDKFPAQLERIKLGGFQFFEAGYDKNTDNLLTYDGQMFVKWVGYKDFNYYCSTARGDKRSCNR